MLEQVCKTTLLGTEQLLEVTSVLLFRFYYTTPVVLGKLGHS